MNTIIRSVDNRSLEAVEEMRVAQIQVLKAEIVRLTKLLKQANRKKRP